MRTADCYDIPARAELFDDASRRAMIAGFRNGVIGGAMLWMLIGAATLMVT